MLRRSGNDATRYLLPVFGKHRNLAGDLIPEEADRLLGWVELELSHNGMLLRGYRSLFASLMLIAAGLTGAALLAVRMGRTINRPLSQIKQAVAQLKDGHLETRLPPLGSQELDELASGINRMAGTLQNAQEELQHSIDQATEEPEPGNHRDPEHRAGSGAQGSPGSEPDQVRIPGQHEP